jgi:lipoprotein-anchoring transpeptidase ErfK/SrfK
MRAISGLLVAPLALAVATGGQPRLIVENISSLNRFTAAEIRILEKLNRVDRFHLRRMSQIVVPTDFAIDLLQWSPIPKDLSCIVNAPKLIVVHVPSQVFGAYEHGILVRWGPVSSGREKNPTPSGLFHLNWRSRARHSTDDPNWHMEWYFNFHNQRGLAFHKYSLPGRPASHACIRLLERDAVWLYNWGESWTLTADRSAVVTAGTPVYIMGEYAYNLDPPWLHPEQLPTPMPIDLQEGMCRSEADVPVLNQTLLR